MFFVLRRCGFYIEVSIQLIVVWTWASNVSGFIGPNLSAGNPAFVESNSFLFPFLGRLCDVHTVFVAFVAVRYLRIWYMLGFSWDLHEGFGAMCFLSRSGYHFLSEFFRR